MVIQNIATRHSVRKSAKKCNLGEVALFATKAKIKVFEKNFNGKALKELAESGADMPVYMK